jgi:hypothetical protein
MIKETPYGMIQLMMCHVYRLRSKAIGPCLHLLLNTKRSTSLVAENPCGSCSYSAFLAFNPDIANRQGSFVYITQQSSQCVFSRVNSQPFHGIISAGNLKMAAAIHFNERSVNKTVRILDSLNLARISYRTFHRYQTSKLQPIV